MGKKRISILLTLFILFLIILITPKSSAVEAYVQMRFQCDKFTYNFKTNDTRILILNISVTYYAEGFDEDLYFADVEVNVYDKLSWFDFDTYELRILENGTQIINVEILMPLNVKNRTKNKVFAYGEWKILTKKG